MQVLNVVLAKRVVRIDPEARRILASQINGVAL